MELSSQEVIYKLEFNDSDLSEDEFNLPEYKEEVYKKITTALDIEKEGYNVYLIDDFSKMKLNNIREFISEIYKYKAKPKDICYVIKEDSLKPYAIYVSNGKGYTLKRTIENLQKKYLDIIYKFYNEPVVIEKEKIIDNIQRQRGNLIADLIESANEKGFDIRATNKGFTFIPIDNGEAMTEKQYDLLDSKEKDKILENINELKVESIQILDTLKEIEIREIEKIKKILKGFLEEELEELITKYKEEFYCDMEIIDFLNEVCNEIEDDLVDSYTTNYEEDETKINDSIMKYDVNVLVDNSDNNVPQVIFEEDPNIVNLLGRIDYKNEDGNYVTDLSLIRAGAILRANEGCLIIRASSLLSNPTAYYNLKKTLTNGKVDLKYNKGYIELISLSGLEPEPIKIREKVILIGDYETYNILYNYDEDFKDVFKIKTQYNPLISIDEDIKKYLLYTINKICSKNNFKPLDKNAIREVTKFLSRKAENKEKIFIDNESLNKIITLSNSKACMENRDEITEEDIRKIVYEEDVIEKEIREYYKKEKILLSIKGKKVGQINGLSVIDLGYFSFGKPIRITCSCYKGEGNIIDVQKQSELSGNIYNKSVNILKGCINRLFGKYSKIPVDFHISFEQIYGKMDGDSASVAELVSMISALSDMGINQNIAVTGSINQFGDIQPIGGVNEKIEGFFKVCKCVDNVYNKGVLIPYSNIEDLVLSDEVEKAVKEGKFHIYSMKNLKEAVNILIGDCENVMSQIRREIKKYNKKG